MGYVEPPVNFPSIIQLFEPSGILSLASAVRG